MTTNEIIAGLRKLCGQGSEYRRTVCRLAADTLESQQARIAELETELKDERYRHDRYVDFELAEAKELEQLRAERNAMLEDLRYFGCEVCKHEKLFCIEEPCASCRGTGKDKDNWEWRGIPGGKEGDACED